MRETAGNPRTRPIGAGTAGEVGRLLGFLEPAERAGSGWLNVSRVPAASYVRWSAAFEALSARAARPNPFMSPAAVAAARKLHPDERIVVLAARMGADEAAPLAGVWCLVETRDAWTLGTPVLQTPLVPKFEPLSSPVLDGGRAGATLSALLGAIDRDRSLPKVIRATAWPADLDPLVPGGVRYAECWSRAMLQPSDRGEAEAYLKSALGSAYKKRTGQERAIARLGRFAHLSLRGAEALAGFGSFLVLEASGWKGRAGTALAQSPADTAYVREMLAGLAAADRLAVDMLTLDGAPVAVGLLPEAGAASLFWKTAYDERLARHSPGVLLDLAVTRRLFAEGRPRLDSGMTEFTDPDSQPWSERLALGRATLATRPTAAAVLARLGQNARHGARLLARRLSKRG